ncbi:MAG: glycosyltransferase family 2 protein [Desulfobacula sp.]|nr:glycosyltransferase family 2 protein [Desulfobacula sp.]
MKASLIIRTKNEERWISSCLKSVFAQKHKDFEVIIVDNESTDSTLAKVAQFPVEKIVQCQNYIPGKSLNLGIAKAEGEFIVCLSGHCIPVDENWLGNLLINFDDPEVAGVYGRQEPLSFTSPADKRDLMLVFGPERRVQKKDSFFHNANSMIRKSVLDQFPFDDKVTNIEDRVWAQEILNHGYKIVYEPSASVYHYHGIHQDGNIQRCTNVVNIMESLSGNTYEKNHMTMLEDMNIAAIIPIKGKSRKIGNVPLLQYAINSARKSKFIDSVVVSSDNNQTVETAKKMGADLVFLRDQELSKDYVGLEKVYKYTLHQMEETGILPDIVVLLEVTYPFRDDGLIDNMIDRLVYKGLDTILPARVESNAIWIEEDGEMKRIDEGFVPRQYKRPVYLSYKGLCCVTRPEFIRSEDVFGENIGVFKVDNPYSCLEIRNEKDLDHPDVILKKIRENWIDKSGSLKLNPKMAADRKGFIHGKI